MKRSPLVGERVFSDPDLAESYARRHRGMAEKFGREYADKLLARGFHRGRIIDVGCGFGGVGIALAKRFPESEVVGIDLSRPLLRLADLSAQTAGLDGRVRFEEADVQQIPYEDDTFDVVINTNMVHLVKDPVKMLDEIKRVLVPDGSLFIADIRRSWVGLVEQAFRSALTIEEAQELFSRSRLRAGACSSSFLWWRFEARVSPLFLAGQMKKHHIKIGEKNVTTS